MISIKIDNKNYKVSDCSANLLSVCLSLGFDIPYFCWHPAFGSIGACRQCVVKQYSNDNLVQGKLVVSCMTPVFDGMQISLVDKEVIEFRRSVLELLMLNHPHDCPVCEEGGNCHLQDMTVMVGQNVRRYRFSKRIYNNQYLGPFVTHEMNRCITCYRCVRYYKDYAGGKDFGVYGSRNNIYFGRIHDGKLESEFSGNLVEVCPTGVFTDKVCSLNYARKWDMQFAPSICQQCSIGCNIIIGERYGELCRVENRYHGAINGYFLCDRGRFGHGYVNLKNRLKNPMQRVSMNNLINLTKKDVLKKIAKVLRDCHKIVGIGSSRASVESNFALRELVGLDNFYAGLHDGEFRRLKLILHILYNSGVHIPSLQEIESYDAILILGEDLTQVAARMALAVRRAVNNKSKDIAATQNIADWQSITVIDIGGDMRYPLFITHVDCTKLDDIATWTYYDSVYEQARFGFVVANILDCMSPKVENFDQSLLDKANIVAQALVNSNKPLVISGSNSGSDEIILAAANIVKSLKRHNKNVGLVLVASDANSFGLSMLVNKGGIDNICKEMLCNNSMNCLIVLESDLYRHVSTECVSQILDIFKVLVVIDHQYCSFQDRADFILSSTTFAESDGTLINYECRAQRFFKCYKPNFYDTKVLVLESWRWLNLIRAMYLENEQLKWLTFDQIINSIATVIPKLSNIKKVAPNASFNICGKKIARSSCRFSGRTAMYSHISVHEPNVVQDIDSLFSFSMEGVDPPNMVCQHIPFVWSPGWNSPQAWNKFQNKLGGSLRYGDPGIHLFIDNINKSLDWFSLEPKVIISGKPKYWKIVPYWYLFGSAELSQRLESFQSCMPLPCVFLSKEDVSYININHNNMLLSFNCVGKELCLPVKFSDFLSTGNIGLPLGFPGFPLFLLGKCIDKLYGVFS